MAEVRIVFVTAPDSETAERLARGLVEARLAACVNLIGGVRSIYRWQGAVEESAEVLMVLKTTDEKLSLAEEWVSAQHPFEVPEFIALAPEMVESKYNAWLLGELGPTGG